MKVWNLVDKALELSPENLIIYIPKDGDYIS